MTAPTGSAEDRSAGDACDGVGDLGGTQRAEVPTVMIGDRVLAALRRFGRWVAAPVALSLPMMGWFVAFHPAVMTNDSLAIWKQATEDRVVDGGSPLYVSLAWASSLLVGSPWLLIVGQILLLAVAFCEIGRALVRLGVPRWFVWPVTIIAVCQPTVGAFSVQMWKDVPYTACLLLVLASILRLVGARLDGAPNVYELRMLYVAATFAMFFRQNGLLVVVAIGLATIFFLGRPVRRPVLIVLAGAMMTFGVVRVAGYQVAGVEAAPAWLPVAWMASDIANVYESHPETFEPDDLELMSSMLPLDGWLAGADCYTLDFLVYGQPLDTDVLGDRREEVVDLWWEVLREQPGAVLGQHVCAASIAWRPMSVHDSISVMYTVSAGIDPNALQLSTDPLIDDANELALDILRTWDLRTWHWLTWRAATWIYPTYVIAVLLAVRRRSVIWLAPIAPMLAQQASLFVVNPAQDARYMIASLFAAYLLIPGLGFLLFQRRSRWVSAPARVDGAAALEPDDVGTETGDDAPHRGPVEHDEHGERDEPAGPDTEDLVEWPDEFEERDGTVIGDHRRARGGDAR